MTQSTCLISPSSHPSLGNNLNGPCVIEVPAWVPSPLGRYYLYFAHHQGHFIRMAYGDTLKGPWTVHAPGVLHLRDTPYRQKDMPADRGIQFPYAHVASPNVHIDAERREIVMYYHGLADDGTQPTRVCFSEDGLSFGRHSGPLIPSYFAGFRHEGAVYGVSVGGSLHRGDAWDGPFETGPDSFAAALFGPNGERPRHFGIASDGNELTLYFTRIGDAPERILKSNVSLRGHWHNWRASAAVDVRGPTEAWEGTTTPIRASKVGTAETMEHALRDPFLFQSHLFFAAGGESAIGVVALGDP
jgi:hypothetical protein